MTAASAPAEPGGPPGPITPQDVTVAVIAKSPRPGRVKTRLCPPCTPEQAAGIAAASLSDTFAAVAASEVGARRVVLDGPAGAWIPEGFDVVEQRGDGLDERLGAAFADADGPMIIIGMDTPQVTAALLDEVVATLCRPDTDAVLGPAPDGGYWVIGLRRPDPAAVVGVPMSLDTTHAAQAEQLTQLGLQTTPVPPLADVDTFDEALEVATLIPNSAFAAAVSTVGTLGAVGVTEGASG